MFLQVKQDTALTRAESLVKSKSIYLWVNVTESIVRKITERGLDLLTWNKAWNKHLDNRIDFMLYIWYNTYTTFVKDGKKYDR